MEGKWSSLLGIIIITPPFKKKKKKKGLGILTYFALDFRARENQVKEGLLTSAFTALPSGLPNPEHSLAR